MAGDAPRRQTADVPILLIRALRRVSAGEVWLLPLVIIVFVFVTSWPLMALAEPEANTIAEPADYWWYFVVTAATVGYGDLFPETTAGHLVGAYVIVGGIVSLTTLFTRLASAIDNARSRRMKGTTTLDHRDHLVLLGYSAGRTERIVGAVAADTDRQVVLCAWDEVESHPMSDQAAVDFVRGDLTDEKTLRRACVQQAESVLVDARDDNEALALTVAVDHLNRDVHLVVALRDMTNARQLGYVSPRVHAVQWHTPRMITEELQDPGITQVYADLMTDGGGGNTYSVRLPDSAGSMTFGEYQTMLGRDHAALALAARSDDGLLVSPPWDTPLAPGTVLYYVSKQRLTTEQLSRRGKQASR